MVSESNGLCRNDGQERAQAGPARHRVGVFGPHRGGHGHAIDQSVQRQADGGPAPGKLREVRGVLMAVCVLAVRMLTVIVGSVRRLVADCQRFVERGSIVGRVVMVKVKKSL